jgi:enamine deaminase RidA (YjgF/YER057c/UK114 family)
MNVEQKIRELGFELPPPPKPVGAYVAAVRTGNLVFTAGQLPGREGKLVATGKVPTDVSLEAAQKAAQVAALNALAAVAGVGSLDCVRRIVRMNLFVNSAAGFTDQAKVANGASELLTAIFGEAGKHSRCAIGVSELPLNAPVELDLVVEVA